MLTGQLAHRCGTDSDTVQSDLAQLEAEIGKLYRLTLLCRVRGLYRIEGNVLNHQLCLFDGLCLALRFCPDRVERDFTAALTHHCRDLLPALQILRLHNLQRPRSAFCQYCPNQRAESNCQFLSLWLRYLQLQCHRRQLPILNQHQRQWLIYKQVYQAVREAFHD